MLACCIARTTYRTGRNRAEADHEQDDPGGTDAARRQVRAARLAGSGSAGDGCESASRHRLSGPLHLPGIHDALSGYGTARLRASRYRSEEHTSELQSLMRISYAVFCLKKKKPTHTKTQFLVTHK